MPFPVEARPLSPGGFKYQSATIDFSDRNEVVCRSTWRFRVAICGRWLITATLAALAAYAVVLGSLVICLLLGVSSLLIAADTASRMRRVRRIVFDGNRRVCYLPGRRKLENRQRRDIPFGAIACLQILQEVCEAPRADSNRSERFYSYEVNLVLSEPAGQRVHVMDSGDREKFIADVEKLAAYLEKPILNQGVMSLS